MPNYIDVAQVRLGQTCPVRNPLPGRENVVISFTPDLFHVTYFVRRGSAPDTKQWIEAFTTWPLRYCLSEPAPGVGFLVLELKGPKKWLFEAGLTLDTPGPGAADLWLKQPPRPTVPLALALADADTGEVLGLRVVRTPGSLATEAREVLRRQRRFLPGDLCQRAQTIVLSRYCAAELMALSEHVHVDMLLVDK